MPAPPSYPDKKVCPFGNPDVCEVAGFELAGLPDQYLDAGALPTLHVRYAISREVLGQRVRKWLG